MRIQIMSKAEQQAIAKYFPKRPILYIGGLGQIMGINAGVLLSQLLYWHGKGKNKNGWIFKTESDIKSETGLTRSNQETAIKKLRELGIIDYKLAQVPAKRHFKVDLAKLHQILPSLKESCKLVYPNPTSYYAETEQSITKTTRKTTTKNTYQKFDKDSFFEAKKKLIELKSARSP